MSAKDFLKEVGAVVSRDFLQDRSILSFEEYLELFLQGPQAQVRNSAQYLHDVLDHFDAVVIGGGFYGARLALMLSEQGRETLLVERESTLLGRASLRNQARVHNGYHYPRSLLTSLRSRLNYARFVEEYSDCVERSFRHYYAIARRSSKVTASQFAEFCRRIGAPLSEPPASVANTHGTRPGLTMPALLSGTPVMRFIAYSPT